MDASLKPPKTVEELDAEIRALQAQREAALVASKEADLETVKRLCKHRWIQWVVVSFYTTLAVWHWHTHTGKANGHQCADVGAALQQVDCNTGGGKVGWIDDATKLKPKTGSRNV